MPTAGVRRAAVIYNPTKVSDDFHQRAADRFQAQGWGDPLWLETTERDPGRAMTQHALDVGVDLVVAAGGDGTVRVIASVLAHQGVPLAIVPAGTGNLLARNLDLPLDEEASLDVALGDSSRFIDLIKVTVDDEDPDHFAVMAGIGIDAVIMDATDSNLKKKVGSLAYFVAAAKNVGHPPFRATIVVDDQPVLRRRAVVCVVANVGQLQANVEIVPGAEPDDQILNVMVASPRRTLDWVRLLVGVLLRRHGTAKGMDHLTGSKVTITLTEPDPYQMDGDTAGTAKRLIAEIAAHAIEIKVEPQDV